MQTNFFGIETVFSQAEELLAAGIPLDVVDVSTAEQPEPRTDKEDIRLLLEAYGDSDLIIALGGKDGIIAIEITPDDGGYETFGLLMDKIDLPVNTPIVNPANGSTYMLYRYQGKPENRRVELGAGLALVADGEYIVVPPQDAGDRTHGWWKTGCHPSQVTVAGLPERLVALL